MCQECEPKFELIHAQLAELQLHKELLEQRIASMEQHHPVMDANTEEAQNTAEEALEQAEEAQEIAEQAAEAATLAVVSAAITQAEQEEEVIPDAIQTSGRDDATGRSDISSEESGISTEESSTEEPIVLAIEPEHKFEPERKRYRFARGRR